MNTFIINWRSIREQSNRSFVSLWFRWRCWLINWWIHKLATLIAVEGWNFWSWRFFYDVFFPEWVKNFVWSRKIVKIPKKGSYGERKVRTDVYCILMSSCMSRYAFVTYISRITFSYIVIWRLTCISCLPADGGSVL